MLPQMSSYIKRFDSGGKNMSFIITKNAVFVKYHEIWDKLMKKSLIVNLFMMINKTKVRIFDDVVHINFCGSELTKEGIHCFFISNNHRFYYEDGQKTLKYI